MWVQALQVQVVDWLNSRIISLNIRKKVTRLSPMIFFVSGHGFKPFFFRQNKKTASPSSLATSKGNSICRMMALTNSVMMVWLWASVLALAVM